METATADIASKPLSLIARIAWAVLILATLFVCYFSHLGALGFVGPDEPRYAWIAREMAESGDWVTPRLYGKPWFEKPPLFYWAAGISFKLFGVSEAAARLPSAISALLATLAVAWLALRLYGPETARWLLLLLPTTVGMIGFSHAAATDMPFSAMLTIAMVFAAVLLGVVPKSVQGLADGSATPATAADSETQRPESAGTAPARPSSSFISFTSSTSFTSFFFGFFLGLAVLAKGPAAIVLSGGAVFFWAIFTRRWREALRILHPVAVASFCLTALPWYILCAHRNPDFFRIFIIEHNFKRYLTPEFQHVQPIFYYGPIVLAAFLPCSLLLLWVSVIGVSSLRRIRQLSAHSLFLVCWSLFCVVFFSVSKSKLPGYILPSVPPIALLVVRSFLMGVEKGSRFLRFGGLALTCFTSGALVAGFLENRVLLLHPDYGAPFTNVYAAFFVFGLLGFGASLLQLYRSALILLQVAVLVSVCSINKRDLYLVDSHFSARGAFALVTQSPDKALGAASCESGLSRSLHYQLNFYLHYEIPECGPSPRGFASTYVSTETMPAFIHMGFHCIQANVTAITATCRRE